MTNLFNETEEPRIGFAHDNDPEGGKEEWLTPPSLIQALGEFDLDPCSPIKRPWPTAKNHYTCLDNGLLKPWMGRVFCNPPYGKKTGEWLGRCAEHKNATALIFARTETEQMFDHVWPKAVAVLFIKGRIAFYHVSGKRGGVAGAPSMLVAWDLENRDAMQNAVGRGDIEGRLVDL